MRIVNTEKQTANTHLSIMANYKECNSRRLKGLRRIWTYTQFFFNPLIHAGLQGMSVDKTFSLPCMVFLSQLHISQHNVCNHPLHCLPLVSHCNYYKRIRVQTCRAAEEFLQKELRRGKKHDLC